MQRPKELDVTTQHASEGALRRGDGPGTVAHIDEATGFATFVWADALDDATAAKRRSQGVAEAAQAYIADYGSRFGLSRAQAKALEVGAVHDLGDGALIVAFRQKGFGFDVFRGELKAAMTRDRQLIAITGRVSPHLGANAAPSQLTFALQPEDALAFAYTDLTGSPIAESDFEQTDSTAGYDRYLATAAARLVTPARVKRVLFPLPERLVPAYYVELSTSFASEDHFAYVIGALDGRLLFRRDLTSAAFTYRVWADADGFPLDSPQGDHTPHPTAQPDGYEPGYTPTRTITWDHLPTLSTNDPWLPAGSVSLIGNNVFAYADSQKPDGYSPGDYAPFITSEATFDRAYDPTKAPGADTNQILAATTQLFYVNNFLHDWYYDSGFKEVDGNAQTSNYGRGGAENDAIKAEANDFSGTNNANMSTPADGQSPRMQMYAFSGIVKVTVTVVSPAGLTVEKTSGAGWGPLDYSIQGDLVLVQDDADPKSDACSALTNGPALQGKIAVIDRGTCGFTDKVQKAQDAGAIGVLMISNQAAVGSMGGTSTTITIPAAMIDTASGNAIKAKLAAGEPVTLHMDRPKPLDRSGTLDNLIVAHEWGHYISNRLIGNSSGIVGNVAHGMGEGWGDFSALLLTVRESDATLPANANYSGAYALAQYTSTGGGNQGYYTGIRRAPYSTNMEVNPLTYKHIAEGVALPPARYWSFGQSGAGNSEVHSTGEVWATMLWECYAALLNETARGLTFDEKRERMKRYYVASMKLTPTAPTMLEAKDAVLAAALATDRVDFDLFVNAFAKRGAGLRALSPPRDTEDNTGAVESFLVGPDLAITKIDVVEGTPRCAADGIIQDGETATLSLTVKNVGNAALQGGTAIITSSTPGLTFQGGGLLTLPAIDLMASATVTAPVTVKGLSGVTRLDFDVVVTNSQLVLPALTQKHSVLANFATEKNALASDDAESPETAWKTAHDPALTKTEWARTAEDVEHHFWRGASQPEPADLYLVSPVLNVAQTGDFTFTFKHRYSFEWADKAPPRQPDAQYFDGGVIELSTDGITWSDIGDKATPTYNATIVTTGKSPLVGRKAYSADSAGYPAWETVTVNLGTAYAGQNVLVRFRSASDDASNMVGWDIDDVAFTNITNKPFTKLVVAPTTCP